MKISWVKTNSFIKKLLPSFVWDIPNTKNSVYLTFDDGPTPEITEWTLNQLKEYNAKATFFCVGDNIKKYPDVFQKIILENHAIGNHTFNHLNGWKTNTEDYIENVKLYETVHSKQHTQHPKLFRPPYGKISPIQARKIRKLGYKIIMWDVLSKDYDKTISKQDCLNNVLDHIKSGSIIVFHDSSKAYHHLEYTLPKVLFALRNKGFSFEKID